MKLKNLTIPLLILVGLFNVFLCANYSKIDYNYALREVKLVHRANKIIIMGDSRMELIRDKRNYLNISNNISFIALSGAKIDWFLTTGVPELFKTIKNKPNFKYSVVINMGVNDLNSEMSATKHAKDYYDYYVKIAKQLPNVDFYLLSVNPIDEVRIFKQLRTNQRIKEFNDYLIHKVYRDQIDNIKYCDSFNNLSFVLPDGLHYDSITDQKIINFIINYCIQDEVEYKGKDPIIYYK